MVSLSDRLADIELERVRAIEQAERIADTAQTPQDRIAFEKQLDWIFELDDYAARLRRGGKWSIPHGAPETTVTPIGHFGSQVFGSQGGKNDRPRIARAVGNFRSHT